VRVIAVAIPLSSNNTDTTPGLHFRGGGIQALAPQGTISQSQVEFVWASSIRAARYRLQIGDATGNITTTETQRSQSKVSLKPGNYWWTVTALDQQGKPLIESQRLTFTIRPR
jgi:hypothetical protein